MVTPTDRLANRQIVELIGVGSVGDRTVGIKRNRTLVAVAYATSCGAVLAVAIEGKFFGARRFFPIGFPVVSP